MKLLIFLRDLAVRMKTRLFFPYIVFATFLYSIKIQININKNLVEKYATKPQIF